MNHDFRFKKNPKPGQCPVFRCTRRVGKKKLLCDKHHDEKWRREHPQRAYYSGLKKSAKRRGIFFSLTFEEFMDVARVFPWDNPPEEFKDHLSIDRIDNARGYVAGNIQVLTVSENVIKQRRYDYSPVGREWAARAEAAEIEAQAEDSVPF